MSYIGRPPAASPLTSADITDGIIVEADLADDAVTAAKLASNAVVNASVSSTTADRIAHTKITPPYYSSLSVLQSNYAANSDNHGAIAHAHSEGKMYYSHSSSWVALAKDSDLSSKQDVDAGLTSISALTTAADKMIYTTGSDTYAVTDLNATSRALLGTANIADLTADQTFTAANRGTITVDNDGSFDLAVTNNFKCTPSGNISSFTFTNVSAATGQSGNIIFVNGSNYTVSINTSVVKIKSGDATTISATGTYWLSYICDGTLVYVVVSGKLE